MSRSKRDILDTEKMLERLKDLLVQHGPINPRGGNTDAAWRDAEALRRISMTLHRWHEGECNGNIQRGFKVDGIFTHEETGAPWWFSSQDNTPRWRMSDREAGAMKRLKAIMARYPSLTYYVQGDPRGCALYILKPGDVPEGQPAEGGYSRGLAVFR